MTIPHVIKAIRHHWRLWRSPSYRCLMRGQGFAAGLAAGLASDPDENQGMSPATLAHLEAVARFHFGEWFEDEQGVQP